MKKLYLILFAAIALTSCNDSDEPDVSGSVRPTRIIMEYENDHYQDEIDTAFVFYKGNKIDSINKTLDKITYEYSANEVIVKYFREDDQVAWHYMKFLLDDKGRVVKVEFYLNVNSTYQGWTGPMIASYNRESYYYSYEYLTNGTVKEQYLSGLDASNTDYKIYKYDSRGNIATITHHDYANDQYIIWRIDSMEYDNKNHYFKNVDVPSGPTLESKINNVTQIKTTRYNWSWNLENGLTLGDPIYSVTTNTYQYDNNGFPISMQTEGNSHYKSMNFKY